MLIENIKLNTFLKLSSLQKSVYKCVSQKISVETIKMDFNCFMLVGSPRAGMADVPLIDVVLIRNEIRALGWNPRQISKVV